MGNDLTEKDFQILDALDSQEITTQRQLAEHSGISLGQVNYVIKSLLEKGLVKIGNFRRNPHKIGYAYLLTPSGIEAKSKLAVKFVMSRLEEYNRIRQRLAERLAAIEEKGPYRIIFVGPQLVEECLRSLIKEQKLNLKIVGLCRSYKELASYSSEVFDTALLFDDNQQGLTEISRETGIPLERIVSLW